MKRKKQSILKGFGVALRGIGYAWWSQKHMRFHTVAGLLAITLGYALGLTPIEWLICLGTITLVFVTEMVNTSIEILVDLVTRKQKYRAMLSKDIAAGSVLIASLFACVVGYLLFFQRLCTLLGWRH